MKDLVPTGYAPYYNLLWRSSTLYVTALAGFVCLAVVLLQDARRVMRPTWKQPNGQTSFPPAGTLAPTSSRELPTAMLRGGVIYECADHRAVSDLLGYRARIRPAHLRPQPEHDGGQGADNAHQT